jgi:hypothetical protein
MLVLWVSVCWALVPYLVLPLVSGQCTGFSQLFSAVEPYGLQEDDERDEERTNTKGKKNKIKS